MQEHANTFLENEPIGSLMRKYSIPCIISLLVAALYNIVDQVFIANADYLGSFGNAANTVVFPLTVVALALAVMIVYFVFMEPIIRSDGSPRFAMASTLAGAVVNLILDPVFIYVFRWGMMGAAVATVLGQVLTAALLIVELFPRQLIGIFGAANESVYYTEFAVKCFRVYLCMMVFACVNKASFIFLQSLGKPWISTFLSMIREVVFGVGFALLLPLRFGLDGVLYSMPVSDVLTFAASAIVIVLTYRISGCDRGGGHHSRGCHGSPIKRNVETERGLSSCSLRFLRTNVSET